jgi:hypothetical protein
VDIAKKLKYLKQHIDSIATHDDAPLDAVAQSLSSAKEHIDGALAAAEERRAAKVVEDAAGQAE